MTPGTASLTFLLAALLCGPAAADALVVNPPPGHKVDRVAPAEGYTEDLSVESTLDTDAGCEIAFQPVSPIGVGQKELNRIAATPAYIETVKNFLGLKFDISRIGPVMLGDAEGVRAEGDGRGGAGVRALATIVETPRGRTVITCIGPGARFATLRPEFEAITRGVVLPR